MHFVAFSLRDLRGLILRKELLDVEDLVFLLSLQVETVEVVPQRDDLLRKPRVFKLDLDINLTQSVLYLLDVVCSPNEQGRLRPHALDFCIHLAIKTDELTVRRNTHVDVFRIKFLVLLLLFLENGGSQVIILAFTTLVNHASHLLKTAQKFLAKALVVLTRIVAVEPRISEGVG